MDENTVDENETTENGDESTEVDKNSVAFVIMQTYVEVANKMGIPHELRLVAGEWRAVPIDQMSAALKQFGSATLGIKAEFWAEKVQLEVERRLK